MRSNERRNDDLELAINLDLLRVSLLFFYFQTDRTIDRQHLKRDIVPDESMQTNYFNLSLNFSAIRIESK